MKALILCGGYGKRLGNIVSDKPKPLAPINGRPFLKYVLDTLETSNIEELVFLVSYKADQIKKYVTENSTLSIKPIFIEEKKPLGTGGAIANAVKKLKLKEDTLVLNGDTYFKINLESLLKFHRNRNADLTIALSNVLDIGRYGEIVVDDKDKVSSFVEKPKGKIAKNAGRVSGGIYVFGKKALTQIKKLKTPFSLETDFLQKKYSEIKMYGYPSDGTHYDIGTPTGYRKTSKYLSGNDAIVIRGRSPLRVSFSGGGTDLPPFDQKFGGCVLNATINKYAYGILRLREDQKVRLVSSDYQRSVLYHDVRGLNFDGHLDLVKAIVKRMDINYGFELQIRSEVPPNSGLGSSAAVACVVIGLLNHLSVENKLTKTQIAELAREVEVIDLKNPGGRQDQYASVYGGFNFFEFEGDKNVRISPVNLERKILYELEQNLLLVYIGKRGVSGKIHNERNTVSKSEYLKEMRRLCYESYSSILRGDLTRFGHILEETWQLKKKAFKDSTNEYIDELYSQAKKAGAIGGRVTGAGGGGHMIFYTKLGRSVKVGNILEKYGAKVIDFSFDNHGLQTWEL